MLTEMVMLLPSALKVGVTLKVGVSGVKVAMFLVALITLHTSIIQLQCQLPD